MKRLPGTYMYKKDGLDSLCAFPLAETKVVQFSHSVALVCMYGSLRLTLGLSFIDRRLVGKFLSKQKMLWCRLQLKTTR